MKRQSTLQKCREIFSREITNPADKIPSETRARVVGLFVTEGLAKPASANVYFSNIRKEILNPVVAEPVATPVSVTVQPAVEPVTDLSSDEDDLNDMGEFEREFSESLDTADV